VFDDGPGKPAGIWSRVGRRLLVAGASSNGDIPMMRFARRDHRGALRLLVLRDDAEREFACTAGAGRALDRAKARGWTVVSIKDDWGTVFAESVMPAAPLSLGLLLVEAEADLQPHLVVAAPVVLDPASNFAHLKPVEVAQGLGGAAHRPLDGVVDALG